MFVGGCALGQICNVVIVCVCATRKKGKWLALKASTWRIDRKRRICALAGSEVEKLAGVRSLRVSMLHLYHI